MIQNIRDNSQSWIAKAIVGVFVVLLSLTGFDAIISASSNRDTAAEVNGENVSRQEVSRLADQQRQQVARQLGDQFNPDLLDETALRRSALDSLVQRALLLQAAGDAGFAFSDRMLDQLIVDTPEFQEGGKFSAARFDQAMMQMGYSREQFRALLRQEMLISQLRAGIAGSDFVTDEEVRSFAALERQTRDFASYAIQPDLAAVQITDEELKAWFEDNKSRFMTPEMVAVSYVELRKEDFFDRVELDEEQIQSAYNNAIAAISEQRKSSHILLETGSELSDEQAKAKLEDLRQQVLDGGDFAELARQNSMDPGSAPTGGDLGFAGRGVWDPVFEDALFALQEGEVSAPVQTDFGWHLIRLDAVQAADIPTLEQMRPELEQDLKEQQVEQRFVEAAKELENLAYESADLQQVAEEMGLQIQQTSAFSREGGDGIASSSQVIKAAFSSEVLNESANSPLVELDPATVLVLRVREHLQPRQQSLEELGDSLRSQLRDLRAAEAAKAAGEALVASLQDGGALPQGAEWKVVEAAGRMQEAVDAQLLQSLFRMPRPQDGKPLYSGVELRDGSYVVLRLDGVSSSADQLKEEDMQMYRRFLSSRRGQDAFKAFQSQLGVEAEIEYY